MNPFVHILLDSKEQNSSALEHISLHGSEPLFLPTSQNYGWSLLRSTPAELPEVFEPTVVSSVLNATLLADVAKGWRDIALSQSDDESYWMNLSAFGQVDSPVQSLPERQACLTWESVGSDGKTYLQVFPSLKSPVIQPRLGIAVFLVCIDKAGMLGIPKIMRSSTDPAFDLGIQNLLMNTPLPSDDKGNRIREGYYFVYAGY